MYNNNTCPINVPGFWNNGDCSLLCRKAEWYDLFIFFFGNYLAHVATVTTRPGEPLVLQALYVSSALFSPLTGLSLGWNAIRSRAIFASTPLQTAARAGALCTVVPVDQLDTEEGQLLVPLNMNGQTTDAEEGSSEGVEATREDIANTASQRSSMLGSPSTVSRDKEHIKRAWTQAQFHGDCSLPPGYTLTLVPWDAEFDGDTKSAERWWTKPYKGFLRTKNPPAEVASNSSYIKVAVSVAQIVFGVVTIYRTRGNQIEKYGYAAFGLSVVPYVWMSLINLLGNVIRTSYPTLYMTNSKWLEEAKKEHSFGPGLSTIGRLSDGSADKAQDKLKKALLESRKVIQKRDEWLRTELKTRLILKMFQLIYQADDRMFSVERHPDDVFDPWMLRMETGRQPGRWIKSLLQSIFGLTAPLIVSGTLSRFVNGESSFKQRFWMMSWLVFGTLPPFVWRIPRVPHSPLEILSFALILVPLIVIVIPPIGGLVVVAQMVREHGVCVRIPDQS